MRRILCLAALAMTCAWARAQVAVNPISQPHQTFVDNSGSPCAFCKLYSYAAGTTTPQPTYTDSGGVSQNTNPIVLDISGGANIWMASALSYKFRLVDAIGTPLWTVDNVKAGGGGLPCSTPYAVQFASSDASALACDPTITINPSSHTIQVGGVISGPNFTLTNLDTVTQSWTLDVTSPATAAASLAPISLADLATVAADSVLMNATAGTDVPTAVALPTGCMLGVNYDTTTHAWSCALTVIPLTDLAAQAADTVVMNAGGSSAAPTAVAMPTGCTNGVNYDTSAHAWSCASAVYDPADHDVSLSRSFGTTYQNTNPGPMRIYGYGNTSGSSVGSMQFLSGPSSASSPGRADTCGATVSSGACGFDGEVPAGWYYAVVANTKTNGMGSAVSGVGSWHEVY